MELTTTGILSLFETAKSQRQSFVNNVINTLREGELDPLKLKMQIACTLELMKALQDNIEYKELLLDAAQKHGKDFDMFGHKFQVKEAGTKWDYSNCGDELYNELIDEQEKIEAKIKERQKFLQTIPSSGVADPNTGAMIYPATKSSTTTVTVTLK